MDTIDAAYRALLWVSTIFLSLLLFACIIRAILGPRITDRIVAINLICAKAIIMIAVLSFLRSDDSLLDIAIVYSMISFLVVVVLSKCYTSLHQFDPFHLHFTPKTDDFVYHHQEKKEHTK